MILLLLLTAVSGFSDDWYEEKMPPDQKELMEWCQSMTSRDSQNRNGEQWNQKCGRPPTTQPLCVFGIENQNTGSHGMCFLVDGDRDARAENILVDFCASRATYEIQKCKLINWHFSFWMCGLFEHCEWRITDRPTTAPTSAPSVYPLALILFPKML